MAKKKETNTRKAPQNINKLVLEKLYDEALPRRKVVGWLMETYSLSQARSYELINESLKEIEQLHKDDLEKSLTDTCEKYDQLYANAITEKNYAVARAILADLSKLRGLLIERQEVKHEGGITLNYIKPTKKDDN